MTEIENLRTARAKEAWIKRSAGDHGKENQGSPVETSLRSVGDSFRAANLTVLSLHGVTKAVLAGKVKTKEALEEAQLHELQKALESFSKPKEEEAKH